MKYCKFLKKHLGDIVIILTGICAFLIHIIMLDKIPGGWNVDEAGMAYDAWCIAGYGVDRYRFPHPVYFRNFGGGQSPMYTYITAELIKIFGFSKFIIRIPSVILSLMVLISGLVFLRIIGTDKKTKIAWAAIYTVLPIFIISGRLGQDCNLMLGFTAIFMMCLAYALKKGHLKYYFIAGVSCGLVLYTYSLSYIVMILFLIMAFVYLLRMRNLKIKQAICFCVPLGLMAAPLIIEQIINILDMDSVTIWKITFVKLGIYRIGELSFPKISNIPKVIKAIFCYDWLGFSSNKIYFNLYKISIPFFVLGFIRGIMNFIKNVHLRKIDIADMLFIWFIAEFIMGMMIGSAGPTAYKLNGIYFSVLFYIVRGITTILDLVRFKKIAATVIVIAYAMVTVSFINYYFTVEPVIRHRFMSDTYEEIIEFIESKDDIKNLPIYIGTTHETYIYYLVSARPSPYDINLEDDTSGITDWKMYI